MERILEAKNIWKSFQKDGKNKIEVLQGVSLEVFRGEFFCLMGPSGVGKTTLLHILGTLDKPDKGSVRYFLDGKEIETQNKSNDELAKLRNQKIGFVFQFHHLLPEFTALENVALPLIIAGEKEKVALAKAKELLTTVGFEQRFENKPAELSGGEQQRVAFARALINRPEIVFADEPTGNLDSRNTEQILDLISRLRKEFSITFVVATHSSKVASAAERIARMKDGVIFEISTNEV
jgi:lipoprotein-releasing system ATP-binding protein